MMSLSRRIPRFLRRIGRRQRSRQTVDVGHAMNAQDDVLDIQYSSAMSRLFELDGSLYDLELPFHPTPTTAIYDTGWTGYETGESRLDNLFHMLKVELLDATRGPDGSLNESN